MINKILPKESYSLEDIKRVVDALDDADGWIRTKESYEASAMIQTLYEENKVLRKELVELHSKK